MEAQRSAAGRTATGAQLPRSPRGRAAVGRDGGGRVPLHAGIALFSLHLLKVLCFTTMCAKIDAFTAVCAQGIPGFDDALIPRVRSRRVAC